jgi:hypothetical protein
MKNVRNNKLSREQLKKVSGKVLSLLGTVLMSAVLKTEDLCVLLLLSCSDMPGVYVINTYKILKKADNSALFMCIAPCLEIKLI